MISGGCQSGLPAGYMLGYNPFPEAGRAKTVAPSLADVCGIAGHALLP
jgi:hypothetical protein